MKYIRIFSFLLLVVLALTSCTNNDYQHAIPAEASAVVKIDMKAIGEKADFSNTKAGDMLSMALTAVVKGKDMKAMKGYIEDPQTMGLDFTVPVYAFMAGEHLGITMKVNDDGDLKDFIKMLQKQGMATKPIERDDLMCGTLLDDIQYAYNDNALLLLACIEGSNANTARMARELMVLPEEDSFSATDAFSRMDEVQQDVVIYSQTNQSTFKKYSDYLVWLPNKKAKINALTALNFDNGKFSSTVKMWGEDAASQKVLDEANKNLRTIEGTYTKIAPNTAVWGAINTKGDWLLGVMKDSKELKESLFLLERAIDIEAMIRSVDGDIAFELQKEEGSNDMIYLTHAQLAKSDFLDDVDYWQQSMKEYGMSMQSRGQNTYAMRSDDDTYLWGVKDKELFFASEQANRSAASLSFLANHMDEIKKNKIYVYVDFKSIADIKNLQDPTVSKLLKRFESFVVKSSSADEITLSVELKDKKTNFLKQMIESFL